MKVYKITVDGGVSLIIANMDMWHDLLGPIDNYEVGETYTITVEEMPETEYYNLPEWDGF